MYFNMTNLKFSKIFKITEKTEKFLPIFVIEFFKLDFWIPGKILCEILVRTVFGCLVTPKTSLNNQKRFAPKFHSKLRQESKNDN